MRADRAVVLEATGFICNKGNLGSLAARDDFRPSVEFINDPVVRAPRVGEYDFDGVALLYFDL